MLKNLASISIITLALTAAATFGQLAYSQNSRQDTADIKTLTGVVSDSMCGAKHMATNKTPAVCTRECVKAGSDYALVVGKEVYVLKGDHVSIDKFAGERATVKGAVSGDVVTVQSIAAAKQGTKNLSGQGHGL